MNYRFPFLTQLTLRSPMRSFIMNHDEAFNECTCIALHTRKPSNFIVALINNKAANRQCTSQPASQEAILRVCCLVEINYRSRVCKVINVNGIEIIDLSEIPARNEKLMKFPFFCNSL